MLTTYDFNQNTIRVVEIDGEPWFVAADVCKTLGYYVKADGSVNTTNALRPLDDGEKTTAVISGMRGMPPRIISESGLYKIVMRSDSPLAKPFQDWVTRVVLPAIRKDGAYVQGEEKLASGEMSEDEFVLKAMQILQGKVERLTQDNETLRQEYEYVSLAEYVSSNHIYVGQSQRVRLSHRASKLAKERGVGLAKSPRIVETSHGPINTEVNVYPRDILDEAVNQLGLFQPRHLHLVS